ncbi:hypothetical protein L914_15630, partial [Phytophthora nicotianae]
MDCVDTYIKPDSGVEVSLIAPELVDKLLQQLVWLPRQSLASTQVVRGVGPTPISIQEETSLCLRFQTPDGSLLLRNV